MKKCAFTIVAKNYIGLAIILNESIKKNNPDLDFFIFVADELNQDIREDGVNIIESKSIIDIEEKVRTEMSFKYNLTEYCTAIKPFCFKYLLYKVGYDKVLYFDPDIYVYRDLSDIYDVLSEYSLYLTPHILFPSKDNRDDSKFLQSGPYNLGFLGVKRTSVTESFLNWWGSRLINKCFDDVLEYTFTDQKWLMMITSLFDQKEIYISRKLGMNVAPWNFYERKFLIQDDEIVVMSRQYPQGMEPLYFVHFSGYDYKALLEGSEIRPRSTIEDTNYDDIKILVNHYYRELKKYKMLFSKYISFQYTYNYFENGKPIEKFHRRVYHRLLEIDRNRFQNPFSVTQDSLYSLFEHNGFIKEGSIRKLSEKESSTNMRRMKKFNYIMKMLCKLIGYNRYLMLLRLLKHFSRYESQIFLIDNKYLNNNINLPKNQTV